MKKDLTKLTQDLEELEKRIKAISTSYTTLAQIIAVRDSLDQLKTCFNELTTAIKEDDDDASLEQLNALSARVIVCETDILALQTDLSSTQEDLTNLQTDLSSTNTIVGEHSTTITNLQATQTSLQSAQTNMQTTISNQTNTLSTHTTDITSLKSRMTTAEANIGALTNGIDVGTLEDRITALEGKKDLYLTRTLIRLTTNEVIVAELFFEIYTNAKINNITELMTYLSSVERMATGFIDNSMVYCFYKSDEKTLCFSTVKATFEDNVLQLKRGNNKYIKIDNSSYNFFVNCHSV